MKRTPLKRKPIKRKVHLVDPDVDEQKEAARRRAGHRCERCGSGHALAIHHRRLRGSGAEITENYLYLCPTCHHDEIHAHPEWARRHGLILSRFTTDHPEPVLGCTLECEVDHLA